MGRPKINPANRLRANTACTICRASKKRCSGSFPCTNCINKGRAHACVPFKSTSTTRPHSRSDPAACSSPAATATTWTPSVPSLWSPMSSRINAASPSERQLAQVPEAGSRSPEATHRTHPRMLRNLQGDKGRQQMSSIERNLFFFLTRVCSIRW